MTERPRTTGRSRTSPGTWPNYVDSDYTNKGKPVDIVGHSMGGLIARVALLGSAQGWEGFPPKLNVDNVVTLSTPHQGVANPSAHDDGSGSR